MKPEKFRILIAAAAAFGIVFLAAPWGLATISNTSTQTITALGDGATTNYTIGFVFQTNSQIEVFKQDESEAPYSREKISQGAGADKYTVTGGNPGTTVKLGTALGATERLVIKRATPRTQSVQYIETAAFPAKDHEKAMDRIVQVLQELDTKVDSKVGMEEASTFNPPSFPDPFADRFMVYNHAGTGLALVPGETDPLVEGDILRNTGLGWATFNLDSKISEIESSIADKADQEDLDTLNDTVNLKADKTALALTDGILSSHVADKNNPHAVTATQVGKDTAQWNADRIIGLPVDPTNLLDGLVLGYNEGAGTLEFIPGGGGGGGSVTTASNVGVSGVGVFKRRDLINLEFKKLNPASSNITITDNTTDDTVDFDLAITGDVVGTTDTQTLSGKDFAQDILPDATNTRDLGSSSLRFKDGYFAGDVAIAGNLEVSGTTTTVNTETLNVEDSNIRLNIGGTDASAESGGIKIEGTGAATIGSLAFLGSTTSKFGVGASGDEKEIVTVSHAQTLLNKTFGDGLTIDQITTPAAPSAGKSVVYPKSNGKLYYQNNDGVERELLATTGSAIDEYRSGYSSLVSDVKTRAVTFTSAMPDDDYALAFSIENLTDSSPIFLQGVITARSASGFTIAFNAAPDSGNYVLHYRASKRN